jgi:RNA polymerase sigma-70 factor (ECF subfamily)
MPLSSLTVVTNDRMATDREDPVAAARAGAAGGIEALYRAHAPQLLQLSARLSGSAADAEDVVHDLFVRLPEFLARYEERGQLGAWLRALTVRLTLDRLRLERRRFSILAAFPGRWAAHQEAPTGEAVDLERALKALSPMYRAVFVLRQIEGYSYDEISSRLGVTPGAARVRYLRALRHLRNLMKGTR